MESCSSSEKAEAPRTRKRVPETCLAAQAFRLSPLFSCQGSPKGGHRLGAPPCLTPVVYHSAVRVSISYLNNCSINRDHPSGPQQPLRRRPRRPRRSFNDLPRRRGSISERLPPVKSPFRLTWGPGEEERGFEQEQPVARIHQKLTPVSTPRKTAIRRPRRYTPITAQLSLLD
jgi:hypothetical protein